MKRFGKGNGAPWGVLALVAIMLGGLASGCADLSPYRYTQTYTLMEPSVSMAKNYDDGKFLIRFHVEEKRIFIRMENHTSAPLAIDWEKAAYVHIDGARHKVAGVDFLFTDNRSKGGITTIGPGGVLNDFAAPVKNVEKLEPWTWALSPLFPLQDRQALANKGKIFGLDLPIQVEGEWKVYRFRFQITNVIPIHQSV
ncbi:MAG: hypothetical protein OEY50_06335 [Nitrospinota bacterium]|nr:hypothetical protein [Nitrospinota bacterium]MDH5678525.1 hypothetical protein [Nitrospinota bacterium]MDH5756723.1 hypothetical protein [Nitrospinota bacterium]